MVIVNVIEITLHQIAKDMRIEAKSYRYREKPYEHTVILQDALGRNFEPKVTFARKLGRLDREVSETINIFHSFRNEVYHIGLQHEAILPVITEFYFKLACNFLGDYTPPWIGYSPGMDLPERATKYFPDQKHFMNATGDYQKACRK